MLFNPEKHCGIPRRSSDEKGPGKKGEPCKNSKGYRTDHKGSGNCYLHGGQHQNGKTAAANERASKLLQGLGQPVAIDPQHALLRMVHWSYGRFNAIINQFDEAINAEKPDTGLISALKREFGEAMDRVTKTSKVTIDADIAERQQKLEEADGQRIRELFVGALDEYERLAKPSPRARKGAIDHLIAAMRAIDEAPTTFVH